MSYFEVVTSSGATVDRFETEGEAGICSDQRPGTTVVEVDGEMPAKFTVEDARRVMNELKADTPENRRRQQLFSEWANTNPGWQSLIREYGDK